MPRALAAAIAALAVVSTALPSPTLAAERFDNGDKQEIEKIVRDYLVANPEVLVEAFQALDAKQKAQQATQQKAAIAELKDRIYKAPEGATLGNADGDVTVVEFFDYNCAYCKRGLEAMNSLIEGDSKLRFILKDLPILSEQSVAAARVSLAVQKVAPDKFAAFHRELLGSRGLVDERRALDVAKEQGIDEAAIRAIKDSDEISQTLSQEADLAQQLGVNGTPAYVIADELVPGAIGYHSLAEKIANVRRCNSTTC
ncbi:DsbA family protein [Consotaella salsifontis]|uniref:Protein-disulfide isomerase n=1 Tax=Consotaella salsifontis TaxID=1365950 RepID=A0A1T4LQM2_9HYPH|nr:DsbA family protein [Consotaella salsifontis]SJZ56926.1 Protein-disulfide isomerase [Consotaella salsifontis]